MVDRSKKLHVGFLFDDTLDSNDGVAQYVKNLGSWLSSQGLDVSYLVGQTKIKKWADGNVYSLARNIPVVFNGNRLSIPLPVSKSRIRALLLEQKIDILHVQMPHSPFMSQRVINLAGSGTAVVGTFHIFPASWMASAGSRFLRVLYGPGLKRIEPVLSVSSAACQFATKTFGLHTEQSSNLVNLKAFKTKKASKSIDIVFLGRLVQRKGAMELLKAFELLLSKNAGLKLVIAGDGPLRPKLEKFVTTHGLTKNVKFLGYISESAKPGLLASSRIACFPSLGGESFGIVLIEAMAAGAGVVIGGDNPGYRTVLGVHRQLLVDPTDIQSLANRLRHFLTDANAAKQMHAWQSEYVKKFDIDVVGPQVLNYYQDAIAKRVAKDHNYNHAARP